MKLVISILCAVLLLSLSVHAAPYIVADKGINITRMQAALRTVPPEYLRYVNSIHIHKYWPWSQAGAVTWFIARRIDLPAGFYEKASDKDLRLILYHEIGHSYSFAHGGLGSHTTGVPIEDGEEAFVANFSETLDAKVLS